MISVAIVAILAAVAYPSYQDSVRKTKRATAQADLMELASFMERFFTENNKYDKTTAGTDIVLPNNITNDDYTFTNPIPDLTATKYTLTAVPQGAQASDICGTLTLSQTGAKGADTTGCW